MKTKSNRITLILSSVVCLLPIILSCVIYNDLPEQIAIHWDTAGNPDNYVPKAIAAFGMPFLFLAINLFSKLRLFNDPKRANASKIMRIIVAWLPPILSLVLVPIALFFAMGTNISIGIVIPVLVGVVLIVAGNYLPKSRQNYTIGIKLPWTLHNADNWDKTNRMAGYSWILGGITLIIGTFTSISNIHMVIPMTIFIIILLIILPIGYSFLLYKKDGNANKDNEN